MARCVTFLTCLLLSLGAGFATYALGAIVWCTIDPDDVGAKLLFTIPIALAGMAVPGIIGLLCLTFRCDFIREPKPARRSSPAIASLPPLRPARLSQPAVVDVDDDDVELALAT